jgi:type VI protein secretion system component Hcp
VGKIRVRWVGLLVAVAIVAGAATAFGDLSGDFAQTGAPVPGGPAQIYLKMTGSATPTSITGDVTAKGFANQIAVLALDLPSTSPGTVPCSDVQFRKPTDSATTRLFIAQLRSEEIPSAVFSEARPSSKGSAVFLKVTLENATITSIHHVDSTKTGAYEDVTLSPTHVAIEWMPTKHITEYNCRAT